MNEFRISVPLPTDEQGMIGRECTVCGQYFKLMPGTGLPIDDCRCPYCCHLGDASDFTTPGQLRYVEAMGLRQYSQSVLDPMLRRWAHDLEHSTRNSLIQLKVRHDHRPIPISHYQERQLETDVTCSNCQLQFAIYGVFATCPD
jgi:hypothetical protein